MMRVVLQVTSGPALGRQIPVQAGELARFGRSPSADVCFPEDLQMHDVHFELQVLDDRCVLRPLASETWLNEQAISGEAVLAAGDLIMAGQTRMLAALDGATERLASAPGESSQVESGAASDEESASLAHTAIELCSQLGLSQEAQALLLAEQPALEFVQVLTRHKLFADAIRVLAVLLPKRRSIEWAHQCVDRLCGKSSSAEDQQAMKATTDWLSEPTEEHRRAAMAAAQATAFETPQGWIAMAVFWSEGSITPEDLPEAPSDEKLTAQAVTAALLMTACQGDPSKIEERFEVTLQAALIFASD